MGTPEQVEKSIKSLNNTELKGKKIVVEWVCHIDIITTHQCFFQDFMQGGANERS